VPLTSLRLEQAVTEPWVSVEQIAEHLGVKRDSIYRWIDRKNLPAHRVGRLWKFKMSEVDEWVRIGGADEHKAQD
jgi:excisionase family DNA binding protein